MSIVSLTLHFVLDYRFVHSFNFAYKRHLLVFVCFSRVTSYRSKRRGSVGLCDAESREEMGGGRTREVKGKRKKTKNRTEVERRILQEREKFCKLVQGGGIHLEMKKDVFEH